MINSPFRITIDATHADLAGRGAFFGKKYGFDWWDYRNLQLESGRIYGIISEYEQGCMYLSYLLGGRVDFDGLRIFVDEKEVRRQDLERLSWNLEPSGERCRNAVVRKAIEKAIRKNGLKDSFSDIQERFFLTPPRQDRKLAQLSGERWRASAALGYAEGKRIFYAPYKSSVFYYQMCQSGLLKALRELTDSGAIVLLPCGCDDFLKYVADDFIYLNQSGYYLEGLQDRYREIFQHGEWIRDVETRKSNRVMQAIRDRRSIRRYATDAVPRETVEEILKAGIQAPSAKNRQPWRFIVAVGKAKAEALDVMEKGLKREKANPLLPQSAEHLQGAWQSLEIMRQAPVVIFVVNALAVEIGKDLTVEERISEICNAQSIGAAMENMSLAAREQGLGSLWICNTFFAQRELGSWLHTEGELYAAMAVGYAEERPLARLRKRLEDVAEWRESEYEKNM